LRIRGALKTGSVTVIQGFNSSLDVSPHFHVLFVDGVYSLSAGKAPVADASARGVVATGPRSGCRIVRVRGPTADVDTFVVTCSLR
jgi:hypothetical protein